MNTDLRRVPVLLPVGDYRALEALADREERTPERQAAFLLRQTLAGITHPGTVPGGAVADRQLVAAGGVTR